MTRTEIWQLIDEYAQALYHAALSTPRDSDDDQEARDAHAVCMTELSAAHTAVDRGLDRWIPGRGA